MVRSSQSATLHWEYAKCMQELEEQALKEESKSWHDFLSAHQAILLHALQSLKENLTTSYHILLGQSPLSSPSALPTRTSPSEEQPSAATSPRPVPMWSPRPKRCIPHQSCRKAHLQMRLSLRPQKKDHPAPKGGSLQAGSPHSNPVGQKLSVKNLTS